VRKPVLHGSKVDIFATYADVFAEADEGFFTCRICVRFAAVTGAAAPAPISVKSNSHNLLSHMATKHAWELTEEHAKLSSLKPGKPVPSVRNVTGAMDQFATRGGFTSFDVITELTLFILHDGRPFRTVEGLGFKALWDAGNLKRLWGCVPPSADTIARRAAVIDEALAEVMRLDFLPSSLGHTVAPDATVPSGTPFTMFSASVDGWTSQNGTPTMGTTISFISPQWKAVDIALGVRHVPHPHTGEAYHEHFCGMLDEYGLTEDHMMGVSTDGASNMLNLAARLGVPRVPCFAHALHNGVQADVLTDAAVSSLLEPVTACSTAFNSIAGARNQIAAEEATSMGLSVPKARSVVPTRWNSRFHALRAHNQRWPVVSQLTAAKLGIPKGEKADDYKKMHDACHIHRDLYQSLETILAPIEEWSTRAQAAGPTLSLMPTAKAEILRGLAPVAGEEATAAMVRAKLLASLSTRLAVIAPDSLPTGAKEAVHFKMLSAAALLDPRTATSYLPVAYKYRDLLIDYIANCYITFQPPVSEEVIAPVEVNEEDSAAAFIAGLTGYNKTPIELAKEQVGRELAGFIPEVGDVTKGMTREERLAMDPLEWWRANEKKYGALAHVARSMLGVPATSASAERIFSLAGFVSSGRRANMSADSLELAATTQSALRVGINLRAATAEVLERNRVNANRKRSATMMAKHAAKKAARSGGAGAGGGGAGAGGGGAGAGGGGAGAGDSDDDSTVEIVELHEPIVEWELNARGDHLLEAEDEALFAAESVAVDE
jgi:hypothetical protein